MSAEQQILKNIEWLLQSDITANKIQQMTGINRSTLTRLKKGEITITNLSLGNAIKLSELVSQLKE